MGQLIRWVLARRGLAVDPGPDFTVEQVRRTAEDECRGHGTAAQREEYVTAYVALAEVDWHDYRSGVDEESPAFTVANRRVADAERALGLDEEEGG